MNMCLSYFLSDPGVPGPIYGSSCLSLTEWATCANLTDVTLADEDTKLCKWRHLVDKFATNASGAIWWSNLQLMKLVPSGGLICN